MTDTNNGWPGEPGVPLNPEKDGWHWVNGTPREWVVFDDGGTWRLAGSDYRPHKWAHRIYQGPCLTPDEAAALQKKGCARDQTTTQFCAEAVALQARVAEMAALTDALKPAIEILEAAMADLAHQKDALLETIHLLRQRAGREPHE